ncbi:MAG: DUF4983 domain-containing protein [Patescibacteria group bacterium]|nr:DUF4983 domain-containing protein [Patescibacteria group bacterium]
MANPYSIDFVKTSLQYGYCNDAVALSPTGDMTLEGWMKLTALPSSMASDLTLVSKWDGSNFSYKLGCYKTTDKLTFLYSSDGTTNAGSFTKFTCDTAFVSGDVGVWKHVAVAVDVSAQTAYFYFNGSSVANTQTNSGATAIYDGTAKFLFSGNSYDSGIIEHFHGKMDEWRLWNDLRTAQEIADNYNIDIATNSAGLAGYWKCNEGSGTTLNDATTFANHLTLVGSPSFSSDVPFGAVSANGNFLPLL